MAKYKIIIELESPDKEKLKDWIGWFMDNNTLKCCKVNLDHTVEIIKLEEENNG